MPKKRNGFRIYNESCFATFDRLEDQNIDMVMVDPPYGTTACKWDSVIPLEPMWKELKRVVKLNGAIVIMANQPFTSKLVCSNLKMFKYDWVWQKPKGTGHLNAKKQPMRDKEDILVFYTKQCFYSPQYLSGEPYKDKAGKDHSKKSSMTDSYGDYTNFRNDNNGFRYPKQVQMFPVVERGSIHPTQKPVALMEYLIKTYTKEGEKVLDFAMGSGTTGVACGNLNRRFVGCDNDKEFGYFEIAKERIRKAYVIEEALGEGGDVYIGGVDS